MIRIADRSVIIARTKLMRRLRGQSLLGAAAAWYAKPINQLRDVHDCAFVNRPYDRVSQILRVNPMVFLQEATDGAPSTR